MWNCCDKRTRISKPDKACRCGVFFDGMSGGTVRGIAGRLFSAVFERLRVVQVGCLAKGPANTPTISQAAPAATIERPELSPQATEGSAGWLSCPKALQTPLPSVRLTPDSFLPRWGKKPFRGTFPLLGNRQKRKHSQQTKSALFGRQEKRSTAKVLPAPRR